MCCSQDKRASLAQRNKAILEIIDCLANKNYQRIALLAPQSRISPDDIELAIRQYGRDIISLPPSAHGLIDYVAIADASHPAWSVVAPLFTQQEGLSDLSLELELIQRTGDSYALSIDNVRVR
jgi:hypothetical protein